MYEWTKGHYLWAIFLFLFGPIAIIAVSYVVRKGWFQVRCPRCRSVMNRSERLIQQPTRDSNGIGAVVRTCSECGYSYEKPYTIPYALEGASRYGYSSSTYGFFGSGKKKPPKPPEDGPKQ